MNAVPKYGEVRWRDAYGNDKKSRVRKQKMGKTLPITASVGHLFLDADGTLTIVHEYDPKYGVYQKRVEMTVIPLGWVQTIVPLIEATDTPNKTEGIDALHQTEPPRTA